MTTAERIRLHSELTDRQQRILDYVTVTITRDDRSPSLNEIRQACNISSTSVVAYNLDRLIERGRLVRIGELNDVRRVRLPTNPWRDLVEEAFHILGYLDGFLEMNGAFGREVVAWREKRAKLIRG
jgi:SOS-response transcriptional repressor LexA